MTLIHKVLCKRQYGIVLIIALFLFNNATAQDYLNINTSGVNYSSLLSEMKEITFDGSGNATFTKNDDSFVTVALNTITDLTISPTSNGGSPLPVELVSFVAGLSDMDVLLNWETATEVNNYGFDVERENRGSGEWEKIGFVEGHGTTNSPKYYEFTDSELPNTDQVSYRLKQIDNDGTFAYSKIVTVDLTTITDVDDEGIVHEFALNQNYPNPFNPSTTINFTVPSDVKRETSNVKLIVYDILGKEMAVLVNQQMQPGNHEVSFNADNFSSGMYFYKLTTGNFVQTKKMLLIK